MSQSTSCSESELFQMNRSLMQVCQSKTTAQFLGGTTRTQLAKNFIYGPLGQQGLLP